MQAVGKAAILPMLRLRSYKGQGCKDVGIHWIALTEYSQMSTQLCQGFSHFQLFFVVVFLHRFVMYWPN